MKNLRLSVLVITTFLLGASFALASSGVIDSVHKYAFSNVGGYINFAPTNGGVTVSNTALTGYAWSANDGWINFAPTTGGVINNGHGVLSGYAWDASAGWVNFSGVTIDSSGLFHGMATGAVVNGVTYAINFDCTYCSVVTTWRVAAVGGGSIVGSSATAPTVQGVFGARPNATTTQPVIPPEPTTPPPTTSSVVRPRSTLQKSDWTPVPSSASSAGAGHSVWSGVSTSSVANKTTPAPIVAPSESIVTKTANIPAAPATTTPATFFTRLKVGVGTFIISVFTAIFLMFK